MIRLWFLVFLIGVHQSAKVVEQREIKTSSGKTFNCFYTINYKTNGKVDKKKSSVTCDPNEAGGTAIEVFDLPNVGKVSIKHSVKKGKEVIQDFSPYSEPSSSVMPMNCSCKVPFPTEMMEMLPTQTAPVLGRRLAPMLMTHDSESNRKVLKVERGLNRVGPILLLLLLPQIIAAIQAALAGRSLHVSQEQLAAKFNRQLFGGGGIGNGALLGALTGGNNAGGAGALLGGNTGGGGDLLGTLTGGNAGGLLGGLTGGNTGGNPGDLLGGLTGGLTGGNTGGGAGGLLGGLLGGASGAAGANPGDLLGALTGNGGDAAGLLGALAGGGDPAELLSNPLVQQMIQQVVQQQLEDFLTNGGPDQIIGQLMSLSDEEVMAMILPYIPSDMQQMVQEVAAMSDEQFMQHVMDQMGINGGLDQIFGGSMMGGMGDFNMTDLIQEWEAPFDVYCDCLPTAEEHGNIIV